MGIISVEQADRLYWLGRYTERVYTILRLYSKRFDTMIDEMADSYVQFCELLDIPNIYTDKEDFNKRYPFDESIPDSIFSNLNRAYDNAMVLRESIGSEALSYIQLSIYEMNKAKISEAPLIEIQTILDNILAFWGIVDDQIDSENIRNIIKSGKRIERIDLYARLGVDRKELLREVHRMSHRVARTGLKINEDNLVALEAMINEMQMDYSGILSKVESIIA